MALKHLLGLTFLCFSLLFCLCSGSCPDDDDSLESWSDPATWESGEVPTEGDDVIVNKSILLDTSPPELSSITVKAGGKLVWSSDGDNSVRTHYILIETNGEMHIGSEDCKFDAKARITLLGEPGDLDIPGFGEKFIGVQAGGTLELHGRDKLSWTKLTRTAQKIDKMSGLRYRHTDDGTVETMLGMHLYHFNADGSVAGDYFASLAKKSEKAVDRTVKKLKAYYDTIPDGDVIAAATQKHIVGKADMSKLYDFMGGVTGTDTFSKVGNDDAYTMITKKGSPESTHEDLDAFHPDEQRDYSEAAVDMVDQENNVRYFVISRNVKKQDKHSMVDFLVFDADSTQPIIDVVDDVSSWDVGDEIFITSTDYNWEQVEEAEVIQCDSCQANQIKLSVPLMYTHYGKIYKNVDMRAEVGLMTRNIRIEGEVSLGNTNGGHVKFLKGFKSVRVEGVELTKMGQPLVIGRYPLHYHMCEDLDDPTMYPVRSYLRKNSIHHTMFRCVTIHGTHGAQLTENVCYDTFGHGFFLEDGGEKRTYFNGNLGLGQRQWAGRMEVPVTGSIPTDTKGGPASFWLTNPLQTLTNNVAAGGEGVGYWFVYPDLPTGPSRELGFMSYKEARHTKITQFENNVAHSYVKAGLFVDNIEEDDLTVKGYNRYNPRVNSTDPKSDFVSAVFSRVTAYKNRRQNIWMRGASMVVTQSSLSDSAIGISILKETGSVRVIQNSVIIGDSDNMGEPEMTMLSDKSIVEWPRSLPGDIKSQKGIQIAKGPMFVENTWLDGFQPNDKYTSGAFGFKCMNTMKFHANAIANVKFGFEDSETTGSRIENNWCNDENIHHFIDLDSSFTDLSGQEMVVVRQNPFYATSACKLRNHWDMLYCPNHFGTVRFSGSEKRDMAVMRTDTPHATTVTHIENKMRFHAIVGGSHRYLAYVDEGSVPDRMEIMLEDDMNVDTVVIGVCVPRDATFSAFYKADEKMVATEEVDSLGKVDSDNKGGKYYFDSTVGVLFFKLMSESERDECKNGVCSRFRIDLTDGDLTDSDCSQRFLNVDEYLSPSSGSPVTDDSVLAADDSQPPQNWGAGSTYPQDE